MAFGLVSLEKRLKENIKNYSLKQLFDIEELVDYVESVSLVGHLDLLLVDRHGEKVISVGNFAGFKPDVVNAPGEKIRVYGRTIGHLYTKEGAIGLTDYRMQRYLTDVVRQLTRQAEKTYAYTECAIYADELEKCLEKEQYRVKHGEKEDALTGTLNSTYFDNRIRMLDNSETVPIAVICANINDWKYVNDRFGDEESDRLIQTVARILKEEAGSSYVIARCGGDLFNILIPGANEGEAQDYCRRVQERCNTFEDDIIAPSVACGVVYKTNVEQSISDLLPDAEYEMFNNKFEIKNAPGYRERLEK